MTGTAQHERPGKLRRGLRRLKALSITEWILFTQMVPIVAALAVALRLGSLPRLAGRITRLARNPLAGSLPLLHRGTDPQRLHEVADLAAAVISGQRRCLPRSLLVLWLIHARGGSARLLVGAQRREGRVGGHAWVESDHWPGIDAREGTDRFPVFIEV